MVNLFGRHKAFLFIFVSTTTPELLAYSKGGYYQNSGRVMAPLASLFQAYD